MSDAGDRTAKLPVWLRLGLAILFLLMAVYAVMGDLEAIALNTGLLPGGEPPGLVVTERPDGWLDVSAVTPGAPGATAGIQPGDRIRYDDRYRGGRNWLAGEQMGVTIDRAGRISRHLIATPALRDDMEGRKVRALNVLSGVAGLVAISFGILVLWRGRETPAAIVLGAVLIGLGGRAHYIPIWTTGLPFEVLYLLPSMILLTGHVVYPSFCLLIAGDRIKPAVRRALHGLVALVVVGELAIVYSLFQLTRVFGFFPGLNGMVAIEFLLLPLAIAILLFSLRGRDAVERNRIRIVLFALFCYALGLMLGIKLPAGITPTGWLLLNFAMVEGLLKLIAPGLLAYVVLKQRLLDLGFVINRTLVYGAVSFILLAGFGLAEWAVDHLIPEEWHKESALYSAGIALLLFLSFHRLRDWIEHHVERLFFHAWHSNEAKLRRFVETAAHYERVERLVADASAEFERFTGSSAAFYWREAESDYRLLGGRLPDGAPSVDADDSALVQLRSDRQAVEPLPGQSAIPAALVFPMIDHGALIGFLAVGPKPDSPGYRPDERDVMAWATQQIGLDCQSLRARDLDARLIEMNRSIVALQAQNDALNALLGKVLPGRIQPAG